MEENKAQNIRRSRQRALSLNNAMTLQMPVAARAPILMATNPVGLSKAKAIATVRGYFTPLLVLARTLFIAWPIPLEKRVITKLLPTVRLSFLFAKPIDT
ncbi:MAG: hypothetical protein AB3N16_11440 [Flavobacteriaceae bacterium]